MYLCSLTKRGIHVLKNSQSADMGCKNKGQKGRYKETQTSIDSKKEGRTLFIHTGPIILELESHTLHRILHLQKDDVHNQHKTLAFPILQQGVPGRLRTEAALAVVADNPAAVEDNPAAEDNPAEDNPAEDNHLAVEDNHLVADTVAHERGLLQLESPTQLLQHHPRSSYHEQQPVELPSHISLGCSTLVLVLVAVSTSRV
jgi:hypothetical protein